MSRKYSILIISSEISPLARTGGLGDMVAALAGALQRQGHDIRAVLPLYRQIRQSGIQLPTALPSLCVKMGIGEVWCAVRRCETAEKIPLYLIEYEDFFNRSGFYHDEAYRSYPDNPLRFGFFSRAALQAAVELKLAPDIVQVHDWHTALVPAYLKTWFRKHPMLGGCASLLTVHNESYQGIFSAEHYGWLGLPAHDFIADIFEDRGLINFLKGGIHHADVVNTVSPAHAEEMKSFGGAFGLAPYINNKGPYFRGILNGVDYDVWSPEKDMLIPARYSLTDLSGKRICKKELQKLFHLEERDDTALLGFIGRLTVQKGIHLLQGILDRIIDAMDLQVVVLGSGEPEFERFFNALPLRHPGKAGARVGFDDQLAHWIEAGADFFLMPSLYEPCGLNQMYSLRYGALPIVHATGGLEDTVEDYDETTGEGTGFKFREPSVEALYRAVDRALRTYYDRPRHMRMLVRKAMQQDFSWAQAVHKYEAAFELAIKGKYNQKINT